MIYKNTFVKIRKSLGRYCSLLLIILIGIGFFAGIRSTAPDIVQAITKFTNEQKLMDYKIVSNTGLSDSDVSAIKNKKGVAAVEAVYSVDVLADGHGVNVQSLSDAINIPVLKEGRLPKSSGECVADYRYYKVGDVIALTGDNSSYLKAKSYTVTGLIRSPLYMSIDYKSATVGDGKLYSYLYVEPSEFDMTAYTAIYVRASGQSDAQAFSKNYQDAVSDLKSELNDMKSEREKARDTELAKLNANFNLPPSDLQTKWTVLDRAAIPGYDTLDTGIGTIVKVADIIPLFFILIVILMTSNTMARMIVEERSELGALVSLGYANRTIISSYLLYVLSATLLGAGIGFFAGNLVIPQIIFGTFTQFLIPSITIQYDLGLFALLTGVAVLLMLGVTLFFCHMELKQKPAALLRPVPPKHGQKIFLERVGFIWKKMSFTWKVTSRNIFRYKQRVFMTIIGVAGCTALLLTGFGIRDSINGVAEKQFQDLTHYKALMVMKSETKEASSDIEAAVKKAGATDPLFLAQSSMTLKENKKSEDLFVVVPENLEGFANFFTMKDSKNGKAMTFQNDSVILTKRIANNLKIEVGDEIQLTDAQNNLLKVRVTGITENYLSNYVYIGPKAYETAAGKAVSYNMIATGLKEDADHTRLSETLLKEGDIVNVSYTDDILAASVKGNNSLNHVVVLVVVVSILLVVIVLYNLTSINISERKREIATLKVLGFTDLESSEYIYREAVLLTLMSLLIGLYGGYWFHRVVIGMIQGADVAFFENIHLISYFWATLIIIAVSVIMQGLTHFIMKRINMIESLKSVE